MNKYLVLLAVVLGALLCLPSMADEPKFTREDAVAVVRDAITMKQKSGKDAVLSEVNKQGGRFTRGGLYLVALDFNGVVLAHGGNAKMVGKNIIAIKDVDGKVFVQQQINLAKSPGSGWVSFKWPNPASGVIEPKIAYVQAAGDVIFAAGIYGN